MKGIVTPCLLVVAFALTGCATQSLPREELAAARGAIATAAETAPEAGELKRAQEKLALSQRWIDARDYGPARWLAEQAQVDAELAAARSATRETLQAIAAQEQAQAAFRKTSLQPR